MECYNVLMSNPDYSIGRHPWPDCFTIPPGCEPIGFDDGIAYFFDDKGQICTCPISSLNTSHDSGYFEALSELAQTGVTFVELIQFDTTPTTENYET